MSIPSFIFGEGQKARTPEELKKMRAVAEAMALRTSAPKNVGEGLQAIGDALLYRKMMSDADKTETEGRAGASSKIAQALFGASPAPYVNPNASLVAAGAGSGAATELAATDPTPDVSTNGSTYSPFIDTVKAGTKLDDGTTISLTNPYGLAAVAATGRAESGWDPKKAAGDWSDPSESGQAGTSGGVMSWRAERLGNLRSYAASKGEQGNGSPQTQGEFLLRENPQLIAKLNAAKSTEEAQNLMNNAWRFAGFDRPGGEAGRRLGYANAYAPQFQGAGNQVASLDRTAGMPPAAAAIEAQAPGSGYVDPSVSAPNGGHSPNVRAVAKALNDRGLAPAAPQQFPQSVSTVANAVAAAPAPFDAGRFGDPIKLSEMPAGPADAGQRLGSQATAYAANPQGPVAGLQPQDAPQLPAPSNVGAPPPVAAVAPQQGTQVVGSGYFPPAPPPPGQQSQGDVLTMQRLYEAAMDPWTSETQQKLILGEIARRQQENDPDTLLKRKYTQAQIDVLEKKASGEEAEEYGLNPVWGQDKNGKTVLGQVSKTGKFKPLDTGDFQPTPGINNIDTGTAVITRDNRTGQVISTTPKDLVGAERDKAGGKAQGEAQSALPQVENAANELLSSIDALANDPYLDKMVGPIDSRLPNFSSDAARVQSRMNQIGGQSFMQAFNSLRGAGQITEQEGAKATAAMGRLATAQNEKDYRDALNDLRGVVQRAVEASRQKAGGTTAPATSSNKTGRAGSVNWSIEP